MGCRRKENRGSATVEFVLVLPWLILFVAAFLTMVIWVLLGFGKHYEIYKDARAKSVQVFEDVFIPLNDQGKEDPYGYPSMDNWITPYEEK